jgi:hypothetical protein
MYAAHDAASAPRDRRASVGSRRGGGACARSEEALLGAARANAAASDAEGGSRHSARSASRHEGAAEAMTMDACLRA